MGPPDRERGDGPISETARHHHHHQTTTRHHPSSGVFDATTRRPQPACYAAAWRHGFGYGFRDALRLAGRRLGPEAWHTLSRLADEYDLAGGTDG